MDECETLDLPSEKPRISLPINRIERDRHGIYLKIQDPFSSERNVLSLFCELEESIALSSSYRGIHVSRIQNNVNFLSYKIYECLDDYASELARHIFQSQPCEETRISIMGHYVQSLITPLSHLETRRPLEIISKVRFDGTNIWTESGLIIPVMMACPCIQKYFKSKMSSPVSEFKESDINSLASLVTHTQRGIVEVSVETKGERVALGEILHILNEHSVGIFQLLKREDERELVLRGLQKASFVEDTVRELTAEVYYSQVNKLGKDSRIKVRVRSLESIHPENLTA